MSTTGAATKTLGRLAPFLLDYLRPLFKANALLPGGLLRTLAFFSNRKWQFLSAGLTAGR
ncbi:hypothetical protein THTE_0820 [Thermogutta terrifontis]|uniref:Uncharacterized protein n=1 Tax=Thermogutta terrifontis TaxID=1331910 RepID=A0A286RBT2_9BACT|nr:hypothetical protein THTE_0820 [Thermogutta terrifontis]